MLSNNQNFPKSRIDLSGAFDDVVKQKQQNYQSAPVLKKKFSQKKKRLFILIIIVCWIAIGVAFLMNKELTRENKSTPDEIMQQYYQKNNEN